MEKKFPLFWAEWVLPALAAVFVALVLASSAPAAVDGPVGLVPQRDLPPETVEIRYVDVNTADREELMTLPGIGPALAQRILDYRQRYGPLSGPEELLEISGIGEATLSRLLPYITWEGKEREREDLSGG